MKTVRFVHAADLHLEKAVSGLRQIPEHLRETLLECPLRAAERVFDTALQEQADFLVLTGDVLSIRRAGPRVFVFLRDQLAKLAEHGIEVYWASGPIDPPSDWPAAVPLPRGVHRFSTHQTERKIHYRHQQPVAFVTGMGNDGRLPESTNELCSVVLRHGRVSADAIAGHSAHYWALGGNHARQVLSGSPRLAIYAGTPQGRSPAENGPHGCTVVDLDVSGDVRARFVATDIVRWTTENIVLAEGEGRAELESQLRERVARSLETISGRQLLVSWRVSGPENLVHSWRHGPLAGELLAALRAEPSAREAWSVSLEVVSSNEVPVVGTEDLTLRGSFLRWAKRFHEDAAQPLDFRSLLAGQPEAITAALELGGAESRQKTVSQAALLGAELLTGNSAE